MELSIAVDGDVVEWQELLNGAQIVSLQGAGADGEWSLSGTFSWNIGLRESAGEGDLTLAGPDGSEIFATLTQADIRAVGEREVEDADYRVRLEYEIDGGEGDFRSAAGTVTAEGWLTREGYSFRLDVKTR